MHALPIEIATDVGQVRHIHPMADAIKRILDISVSIVLLCVLLPPLSVLAVAAAMRSPGPLFYQQARVGRYGRIFTLYKLRSMVMHAEQNGPALSLPGDTRITPIGRFLRRYHLDEVPQLWNVIRGDMSLVGPRPERPYYVTQIMAHAPEYTGILQRRPGITGLSQLQQGYTASMAGMLQRLHLDQQYIASQTLALDISILFKTAAYILRGGERR